MNVFRYRYCFIGTHSLGRGNRHKVVTKCFMGHVTNETLVVIRMMANPLEGGALKETVKAV